MAAEPPLDLTGPFGSRRAGFRERLVWRLSDWPGLPQRWRQRLRKRFARPVAGPFDVVHRAMKFRLYPAENYCDRVIFGRDRLPEQAEHEALLPLLEDGMVFVDIGANVGSYALFVATHANNATVVAFEPHPRTFAKLVFNLEANGVSTDYVFNHGIGAEDTVLPLWSDGGSNIGHTSLLPEGTAHAARSVEVAIRPLTDVLAGARIHRIDLLKIDIEGYEDRAIIPLLEGDPALLPRHILIEIVHRHLWQSDVEQALDALGYRETFATPENRLFSRPPA